MIKLIPFAQRFIAGTSTRTVSARKLHEFLDVKRDFSSWIKARIEQYDFEQNTDYLLTLPKTGERRNKGLQGKKEYFITVDMAKELAMVERNDKGKQARRYFINCEKQLKEQKQLPLPTSSTAGDDAKCQMLNAMIQQMGFVNPPLLVPFASARHQYFYPKESATPLNSSEGYITARTVVARSFRGSPVEGLIKEHEQNGHNVDGVKIEYEAMRSLIKSFDQFAKDMFSTACEITTRSFVIK